MARKMSWWRRLLLRAALGEQQARAVTVRARSGYSVLVRAREAVNDLLMLGAATIDDGPDAHLYREAGARLRDLPRTVRDRSQSLAFGVYMTTPIGRRAINLVADYVVGDGWSYDVEDVDDASEPTSDEVREVLRAHWDDPQNGWSVKLRKRTLGLGIWGEAIWPVFERPGDGLVRVGSIDPSRVLRVELDPENVEHAIAIVVASESDPEGRRLEVVSEGEDGLLRGDVIYGAVNVVPGATRGSSDLLHVIDWIDAHEQLLMDAVDAARLRAAITWDVTVEGATQEEIYERAANSQPPEPGSVRYHNEREVWQAVAPELGAPQHDAFSRMIRIHILGSLGIPEHWYGEGDSATRATAAEMSAPVIRSLATRRAEAQAIVLQVLRLQIDSAIRAGALRGTPRTKERVRIVAPPLEPRDATRVAAVLAQVSTALSVAEEREWVSPETARRLFAHTASELGVEIDPAAEAELLGETSPSERDAALRELLQRAAGEPVSAGVGVDVPTGEDITGGA